MTHLPLSPLPTAAAMALLLLAGAATTARAQDVESFWSGITTRLDEKDILRTTGSLQLRAGLSAFASTSGAQRRSAPFTYGATAALNFDLLGIQAPFTLAYANRNTTYNLPSYTFAGLSPSYKWITLHAGDRSMRFSPYSLNGVNFRGAGFELTPGRWTVAAMRGRLRTESIEFAGADQSGLLRALRRTGQGVQVGYGGEATRVAVSLFHSRDRVVDRAADTATVERLNFPESNLVLTLGGRHAFSRQLSLEVEYARSALTRDTEAAALADASSGKTLFGLHDANVTTSGAGAVKGAVQFAPGFATLASATSASARSTGPTAASSSRTTSRTSRRRWPCRCSTSASASLSTAGSSATTSTTGRPRNCGDSSARRRRRSGGATACNRPWASATSTRPTATAWSTSLSRRSTRWCSRRRN